MSACGEGVHVRDEGGLSEDRQKVVDLLYYLDDLPPRSNTAVADSDCYCAWKEEGEN
jgi:hypothetical protein